MEEPEKIKGWKCKECGCPEFTPYEHIKHFPVSSKEDKPAVSDDRRLIVKHPQCKNCEVIDEEVEVK